MTTAIYTIWNVCYEIGDISYRGIQGLGIESTFG